MSADGARKLFVGGLADAVSETDIRSVFEGAGFVVQHLALPRDRDTGKLRGFAFVTLESEAEASRARSQLQGVNCGGRPLSLREFSQEPPKRGAPGERPKREPEPTVFLGKLPFEATQEQIADLFASKGAGPIVRLTLPLGPDGRPRGFGFATLATQEQVDLAVTRVNGASLSGRQIVVSPAQPRGAPGGAAPRPGGTGDSSGPRRSFSGGAPRFSDRPPAQEGGFDPFEEEIVEPAAFPPPAADARPGRRRESGKKEKKERKRGASGGASVESGRGAGRKRRGGGDNWHRWETDDE